MASYFLDQTMFKVKIFAVGRCKQIWLLEALAEYEKRSLSIEWRFVKDDAELIRESNAAPLIALHPAGKLFTTEELSQKWPALGARLHFAIGGPEGLPEPVLARAAQVWSLSPLIFPNQLVRLLLVEQIYRVTSILQGAPYHKSEPHGSTKGRR